MPLYKEECGHPTSWIYRLVFDSRVYTYCAGCIVEKLELNNLEVYDNPFIKLNKPEVKPKKQKVKEQ